MYIRLALSGSGFLAGLHAGAVCALHEKGYEIAEVAGTSGGSILAAAIALGMSDEDLYDMAVVSDWSSLLKFSPLGVFSGYYCDGNALYNWLDQVFEHRTLQQTKIPVQILSTDVGAGKSYTFDCSVQAPLALACRASAAVPFVYAPVEFQGRILVDGGVCNNIPVDKLAIDKLPRIGLEVIEASHFPVTPLWARAGSLVSLMLAANEGNLIHLATSTGAHIIGLPAGNAGFLNAAMPFEDKHALFQAGYAAMETFLKTGSLNA